MEIQYAEPKIIRFDINSSFLKKRIQPLGNLNINTVTFTYPIFEEQTPIMLRIKTTVMNKNIEVLGYTSEFNAALSDTKNGIDLKLISRFIQNSFLNYQSYFEQNAPDEIKNTRLDSGIDEHKYAKIFEDQIRNCHK